MIFKSTKKIRDLSVYRTGSSKSIMKFASLSLIFVFAFSFVVLAQTAKSTVKGRVISSTDNNGVPGANILVKGTTIGTTTDIEGNFTLEAGAEDVLVISYIGFLSEEV